MFGARNEFHCSEIQIQALQLSNVITKLLVPLAFYTRKRKYCKHDVSDCIPWSKFQLPNVINQSLDVLCDRPVRQSTSGNLKLVFTVFNITRISLSVSSSFTDRSARYLSVPPSDTLAPIALLTLGQKCSGKLNLKPALNLAR